MADWRDGLKPLDDWRKDLPPTDPNGPKPPNEASPMGSLSNVVSMGATGAQLGSMLGPFGAATGGLLGGAAGAFMPPSETPLTDLGATAGDLISSIFLRGAPGSVRNLAKTSRMARAAKDVIATGLGSAIGATGDKALGFQKETPWGNVAFYSALATPGAIVGGLGAKQSPIAALAEKHGIPLSTAEATGLAPGLESMVTRGTPAMKELGQQQTAAAQSALAKIIGAPTQDSLGVVLNHGLEGQNAAKKAYGTFVDDFVKKGTTTTTKQVPSGFGWKTVTETTPGPKPTSVDFEKAFGLTPEESWGFRQFIRAAPDQVVESLVPKGENQVKGLLNLRATMTVLDKSGYSNEAGNLGQAFVMRYLRELFAPGAPVNGKEVAKRIEFALGNSQPISAGKFTMSAGEPGHLVTALGPQRAEALRELAEVLKDANPLEKVANRGNSQGKEAGSYLFNKVAFTGASLGGAAMAGGGAPIGSIILGAGVGGAVAIALPTALGKVLADPMTAKLLVKAAKGDTQSGARFVRSIISSGVSEEDRDGLSLSDFGPAAAKSRLQGLFIKK